MDESGEVADPNEGIPTDFAVAIVLAVAGVTSMMVTGLLSSMEACDRRLVAVALFATAAIAIAITIVPSNYTQ